MKVRLIYLLITCAYITTSHSQTCIIGRLEKKKITVISDTRMKTQSFGDLRNAPPERTSIMKKIGGGSSVYFAVAGYDIGESYKIADELCRQYNSLDLIVEKFIAHRKAKLEDIAVVIRKMDPYGYEDLLHYGDQMQFMFFCFVRGKPKIIEIRLEIVEFPGFNSRSIFNMPKPSITVKKYVHPDDDTNFQATGISYIEDIKDSLYLKETWKGKSEIIGERLMRKQIDSMPEIVGAPIDILILRKNKNPVWKRLE